MAEIQEFITGVRPMHAADRVLATVLFTDIVDSTGRAAELGDHAWRELLGKHERLARRVVAAESGRVIKSTGDGILATFDGPARAVVPHASFRSVPVSSTLRSAPAFTRARSRS